ncbi:MAG: TIGR00730 family Rossman fold protein [Vicinamibacterales bacterium]
MSAPPALRRVCVFCGSHVGIGADYRVAAEEFGRELVTRRIELVFGGGRIGLMGHLADAVLAAGGHAIGVIPHAMIAREIAHTSLPDLRVVRSMHERKSLMAELADAFVALPGGFGTFEELCEAITWTQLGLHTKRCGLLNVQGYYDPLLSLFARAVAEGFVRPDNRDIVVAERNPGTLLDRLAQPMEPSEVRWLRTPDET